MIDPVLKRALKTWGEQPQMLMVVEEMSMKNFLTLMKLSKGGHSIVQLVAAESCLASGKKIATLSLPKDCLLIAIYHCMLTC